MSDPDFRVTTLRRWISQKQHDIQPLLL